MGALDVVFAALLVLLRAAGPAGALMSFDCSKPSSKLAAVSLLEVAPCPPPAVMPPPVLREVQVVQTRLYNKVTVRSCRVDLERRLYYCGSWKTQKGEVLGGHDTNIHWLTPGACLKMHVEGTASIYGNPISGLQVNAQSDHWLTIRGSFQKDSSCYGMHYFYNGESYDSVSAAGNARITLRTFEARVDLDKDTINLPSGGSCAYRSGDCRDVTEGNVLWDYKPMDDCDEHKLDVLYSGTANLTEVSNSSTYLTAVSGRQLAALVLRTDDPTRMCNATAYPTTGDPRIFVLIREAGQCPLPFTKKKMEADNVDLMYYIDSVSLFLELSAHEQANVSVAQAVHRRCEAERTRLQQTLLLARASPDPLPHLIKDSLGYTGVVRGDVLYVAECEARNLPLRVADHCYLQIPVWDDGREAFVEPATRVLVPEAAATEVDCSSPLLPLHFIDYHWVIFTPNITNASVPVQRLDPVGEAPHFAPQADFIRQSATHDAKVTNDPKATSDLLRSAFQFPTALSDMARRPGGVLSPRFLSFAETFGSYCSIFVTVWVVFLALRSAVRMLVDGRLFGRVALCVLALWRLVGRTFAVEHEYVIQNESPPVCNWCDTPPPAKRLHRQDEDAVDDVELGLEKVRTASPGH